MTEPKGPQSAEPNRPQPESVLAEWISRAELGAALGVSVDTLARWETRRVGPPCIRIGRRVYYRINAVRGWLVRQEGQRERVR